jgi:predicted nuclease of predicted toxin-antitoxin system
VKFLVDAQLPRRLAHLLRESGHDARHTLDLPDANRTPDTDVAATADVEDRTVVTKDSDFFVGHLIDRSPRSLLMVVTGNITNNDLMALFDKHLDEIVMLLGQSSVVELGRDRLIAHADHDPDERSA